MKEYVKKYGLIFIGIVVIGIGIFVRTFQNEDQTLTNLIENQQNEQIIEITYIYVDIKGAVENPGVYKLEQNSRLFQLIELAGGLVEEADQNALNFSIILGDQDVVYVPTQDEAYPNITISSDDEIGGIININTADQTALETLPGIGPATAKNIIDYRNEIGTFSSIEEIMNVSGIGESTFNEIKALITI